MQVSTSEQNLDRQLQALEEAGVPKELIYQEKLTGSNTNRPEL
jgi:DNA invertase Pin-like site-specific DNA recombinase